MNIGDIVRAARDIWQHDDDGKPLMLLAESGNVLRVRRVGVGRWDLDVGHLGREPEAMFGVDDNEIVLVEKR